MTHCFHQQYINDTRLRHHSILTGCIIGLKVSVFAALAPEALLGTEVEWRRRNIFSTTDSAKATFNQGVYTHPNKRTRVLFPLKQDFKSMLKVL